jgi:hypothetical protein
MIERGVQVFEDYFNRAQAFTTTPGMNGWTIADTSAAGTPTYLCATDDGGKAVLTLANTNEAENVCLYQNDVLAWDVDRILIAEFTVLVSGVDANTVVTWGLASARNDDEDAIANSVFFKIEGGASTSNVVAESDDGTTDHNDIATGKTLAGTAKKFVFDFTNGKNDIRYYIDGERVAAGTTFTLNAITSQLQPFFQLEKTTGTGTPALTIKKVKLTQRYAYGA